ncbi:MAG: hypothetical protein GF344_07015 [Chitinivibrionales bacterium]|nr:hypothetical protein [Chitinivibrionales bacterium]MBD3356661.1 hypothetical protein [Chitinivibrionales bacterium]
MKRMFACSLAVLILASMADAKLRARYYHPRSHDSEHSHNGAPYVYRIEHVRQIVPGIWKDFDDSTGFDNVVSEGDFSEAPLVTAEYWLDSAYKMNGAADNEAPLAKGWIAQGHLRDTSYHFSKQGYCVIAAGGIPIEETGTYEFKIDADDGALVWIDSNGDGAIDITSETDTMGTELVNLCAPASNSCGSMDQLRCGDTTDSTRPSHFRCHNLDKEADNTFSVDFAHTGLTKIMIWYWEASNGGYFELSWRKPGGEMQPISGTNGDWGEPISGDPIPSVLVTQVAVGGESADNINQIEAPECVPVTFTAEASGMNGIAPVFFWDLYGNGSVIVETDENTVTYGYSYGSFLEASEYVSEYWIDPIEPTVWVRRGELNSFPTQQPLSLFVQDDPEIDDDTECSASIAHAFAGSSRGGIRIAGTRVMVPATGRSVVRIFDAFGRRVVSLTPKSSIDLSELGLTQGYYVVRMLHDGKRLASRPLLITDR